MPLVTNSCGEPIIGSDSGYARKCHQKFSGPAWPPAQRSLGLDRDLSRCTNELLEEGMAGFDRAEALLRFSLDTTRPCHGRPDKTARWTLEQSARVRRVAI
jgi:hypothetical protein